MLPPPPHPPVACKGLLHSFEAELHYRKMDHDSYFIAQYTKNWLCLSIILRNQFNADLDHLARSAA
jgi:hypothetical protein